jgi:hypothetical protein
MVFWGKGLVRSKTGRGRGEVHGLAHQAGYITDKKTLVDDKQFTQLQGKVSST